jgi:GH25 family lysozyme M1 (1,4-beta-N-acetylmuramidase)
VGLKEHNVEYLSFKRTGALLGVVSSFAVACVTGLSNEAKDQRAEDDLGSRAIEADNPDAAPPRRVCPTNQNPDGSWVTVDGFDVSDWQYTDWDKVRTQATAKFKFAFLRISAGLVRTDTRFKFDWPGAKRAGLVRGAYQYFKPSQSSKAQADLYLRRLREEGGLQADDLPPVLDVETTNEMPTETVVCRIKSWLSRVERATGRVPIIYTAERHGFLFPSEQFRRYPLWVANYVGTPSITCPRMPDPWQTWKVWQWSDKGFIPGVYTNGNRDDLNGGAPAIEAGVPVQTGYDVNFFDGTLDDLHKFVASTASTGDVADPEPLENPPHVPGAATEAGPAIDCADDGCCQP